MDVANLAERMAGHRGPTAAPTRTLQAVQGAPAIEISQLSVSYRTRRTCTVAIEEISLDVTESEFIAIVGPSGSGKSTLLRVIADLKRPASGHCRLFGTDRRPEPGVLGMMFQKPTLLPWHSVIGNVMFPAKMLGMPHQQAEEHAVKLLEATGLAGKERAKVWELSGGMQQRVAVCRTLISDPKLLLLDEPFAAVDMITREGLHELVLNLWAATRQTVALVTHSIEEACYLADRVFVLSRPPSRLLGQVVVHNERGSGGVFRESPEFLAAVSVVRSMLRSDSPAS